MQNPALHLMFVCPEWTFDRTGGGVRVKIENGIVFFKPAPLSEWLDAVTGTDRKMFDVLNVKVHIGSRLHAIMQADNPIEGRLQILFERLGWAPDRPVFELQPAQRGWLGITQSAIMRPSSMQIVEHPIITREIVQQVVSDPKSYLMIDKADSKPVFVAAAQRRLADAPA